MTALLLLWGLGIYPRNPVDATDWRFAGGIAFAWSFVWPVFIPVVLLVVGLGRVAERIGQ